MIPSIIHQTWKNTVIPRRWQPFVDKVQALNPDWDYRLWTDADNDRFVQAEFPDFYPIFRDFPKVIMQADVIRYLILYKIGGVYLDLDYEMFQPFTFQDEKVVIPLNRSISYGDDHDGLGNCIMASEPGHPFWLDVIAELSKNPPTVSNFLEVVDATGPGLLTRVYHAGSYDDIGTPDRLVYHPKRPRTKAQRQYLLENGITQGMHHVWGSWREKYGLTHLLRKLKKRK